MINTAGVEPDPAVAEEVATFEAFLSSELDIEIGETPVMLDTRRTIVRAAESAFGNLTVDAMRAETGADVAITNGGGIRGDTTYEPGTVITRRDVITELPFGNKTVLLEVNGADILAALENGVSAIEDGGGRYPHVSGMTFAFDPSQDAGARITEVMVAGAPLDEGATFLLATNDFMGRGGDGYAVFADKPSIIEATAAELMAAQVIRAFESGAAAPVLDGRVTKIE